MKNTNLETNRITVTRPLREGGTPYKIVKMIPLRDRVGGK